MVESKYVLYGVISGLISGALGGALIAIISGSSFKDFMYSLTYYQLSSAGIHQENASAIAKSVSTSLGVFNWLIPLGAIINMLFLGALLGVLMDYLVGKGLRPLVSALTVGGVLIFGLQLAPLYLLNLYYGSWFLKIFEKYIGLWVLLAPSIVFTVTLALLTCLKGPWVKLEESKPEIY